MPTEGVTFILGNDLAGGDVFPPLVVVDNPVACVGDISEPPDAHVFPSCVVTQFKLRRYDNVLDFSGLFFF